MLEKTTTICDCRTGSSTRNPERILILSGLVNYMKARNGIFIRDYITEKEYQEFGERLNVRTLSVNQLEKLEHALRIDKDSYYGSFSQEQEKINEIFEIVKTLHKDVYDYIMVKNWQDPPHQRILTYAGLCDRFKISNTLSSPIKTFVLGYLLSLLAISILEFMRDSLYIKDEEKEEFIRQSLVGGRMSYYERRELLITFYEFMTTEIYKKYQQRYPITQKDFVDQLILIYTKYLIDFIKRLSIDLKNARNIPRIIDLVNYEILLNHKPSIHQFGIIDFKDLQQSIGYTHDLLTFAFRAKLIDEQSKDSFEVTLKNLS